MGTKVCMLNLYGSKWALGHRVLLFPPPATHTLRVVLGHPINPICPCLI